MTTQRSRKSRNSSISITPEVAEWYRFLAGYYDRREACRELDYPDVCETHHLCDKYHDLSTRLSLALRIMPHQADPLQSWDGLLWQRFNEKIIPLKKALELAIGNDIPADLDEQIMRVNSEIAKNGRQGRY